MLGHSVLGCKHYFSSTILLPFSSYTRDCSKRLAILHRLKLEFLPIACKIITTMIMLLVVLFTSHKPALASHLYSSMDINNFPSSNATR
jgi:hypothetical protein